MTYKEMYFYLYGQTADALDAIYAGKMLQAVCILEQAQRKTEEMAIEKDMIQDFP